MKQLFNKKIKHHLIVAIYALSMVSLQAYNADYGHFIANEILRGFDLSVEKREIKVLEHSLGDNIKKLFSSYESNFKPLEDHIQLHNAFKCQAANMPSESVLDTKTVVELDLVRGSSRAEDSLVTRLGHNMQDEHTIACLQTIFGKKCFAEMLTMPISDIRLLTQRQEIIKHLCMDQKVLNYCFEKLHNIKKSEQYIFEFMDKNEVESSLKESLYPSFFPQLLGLGESRIYISSATRFTNALLALSLPIGTSSALFGAEGSVGAYIVANVIVSPLTMVYCGMVKGVVNSIKDLQERLIGFAQYIRNTKRLLFAIKSNPQLSQLMPKVSRYIARIHGRGTSEKFALLNDLLLTRSAFDNNAPSALSSPGDILVAYQYMADPEVRKEYNELFNFVGELDVYVALAQKIVLHEKSENAPFAFVEYIENAQEPIIEAKGFWNPFVDQAVVVPNDVSFGGKNGRAMLITGPNTGGKSTNMKALAISMILAQTFGIAPARSFKFSLMSKMCTYLNVTDDTGAGLSLFKSEVKRAQELMDTLKALPKNQYAFVMIDEIFTGTSPDKAEELSYQFMKKITEMDNVILIAATHFKRLTVLEKEMQRVIRNFQVGAIVDAQGKVLKYTYKITPGISQISSAQQVAEEGGITF